MAKVTPQNINSSFVVLDDANNAISISVGDLFYEKLEQQFGDFKGKRLISHYTFEQDWESWERHPAGEEFVCLLSGQIDFVLEQDGGEEVVSLNTPGQYILVPRGVWHTAKVHTSSSVLFITPGEGTQSRSLS
ncbi:MAG: cupin domain-containing protein [Scytolyngbya sp. HA4215-MV1]|nr:cupin domain-containing protein [Scytolyngbya sp. HA4215-MV1]